MGMLAHAAAPLRPLNHDVAEEGGPVTVRSFNSLLLARDQEETTAIIPASLLLALRARAAQEEGPSQVDVVELDPAFVIAVDGVYEEGTPPACDGSDEDDFDVAFDALRAP
jgi:hypothetical protein